MSMRGDWSLAREGVTIDTFVNLIKHTALNPALTLPLILLARYTAQGTQLAEQHGKAATSLKALLALGALHKVGQWLDDKVLNNWKGTKRGEWDWKKEVVVVTGGSDGIGSIIVKMLAEKGITVAVLDVQGLKYEAPPSVTFFKCDLADRNSIIASAEAIKNTLGAPTVLINNAGCARGKTILDATEFDIRLTFNVNSLSHYFLAQQFLPAMIKNNHGMVVTVASIAGYVCAPAMVDYAASKSAAIAFHEGLTAELSQVYDAPKVRTVLMCQGYTKTALFEGFGSGGALFPETVAEEIVKAVLGGRSRVITLPETAWMITPAMRGWPVWMQYGLRKGLDDLMSGWKGRQVSQPSEDAVNGKGKEKGVEESAVIVG